ncbi:ABC transporter [Mycolicibacterium canariasense]|uniref:ABC transporter n=1 Tax=Mycolicibacterium canariasense TaxID=228230 RepID=A0A100W9Y4_MYCCR|nr:dipeptide/oligopeptide/nickel ABC transporter ATP-binding protein [Mycolicibacterium canariasense]MCV7208602.1 ABC transporter ATP-binding protein [Mycolicibacterium canariasense]ORV07307.1 ABC transporter [Mycolicibacterium canariasense]GAS94612.1 ABC transporter [Mycolicibacterium canariasense]
MSPNDPLVAVRNLTKVFTVRGDDGKRAEFVAVDAVSFDVPRGQTYGLIGESGSGKTTTGRMVLGLEKPTSGSVTYDGNELVGLSDLDMRKYRKHIQIVFQDSGSAFNPRRSVGAQIAYPLTLFRMASPAEAKAKVLDLLDRVGMLPSHYDRYIHEFSGGQRQRLGIARALVTDPDFVVLDEPTAALDVSVQAQILNLLKDLQRERKLTMLLITHNLALVEHMCEHAGVLDHGKLVESGPVDRLLTDPGVDITRRLVDAVLEPELPVAAS